MWVGCGCEWYGDLEFWVIVVVCLVLGIGLVMVEYIFVLVVVFEIGW